MSRHPKLDEAIKRGEIAQCPHCQTYWVASCHVHECIGMVRAQLQEAKADAEQAKADLAAATERADTQRQIAQEALRSKEDADRQWKNAFDEANAEAAQWKERAEKAEAKAAAACNIMVAGGIAMEPGVIALATKQACAEADALKAEVARLKVALTPRLWTDEMNRKWHESVPDLFRAFHCLRVAAGIEVAG